MSAAQCDILVVDDQAPVRQMMRLMLTQFGMGEVGLAHDGVEAVAMLAEAVPRALIADINMPNMNGLELLKRVRCGDTGAPRDLPVLMLTGHGESVVVSTAIALDVDGFVLKPAGPSNMKPRLERVLAGPRTALKDVAIYRAVAVPDVSSAGARFPVESLTVPPGMRVVPLEVSAVDKVLAVPVTAKDGWPLYPAGVAVTMDMLVRLSDLAEIGLVHPGLIVRA